VLIAFRFRTIAISQLPHVQRIMGEFAALSSSKSSLEALNSEFAEVMLAASRFYTASWKREVVGLAKRLSENVQDPYLHICIAQRESSLLRIQGNIGDSSVALERFIDTTILPGGDEPLKHDARWNAQRGELIHSFAENLIQQGLLDDAERELLEWSPIQISSPSTLETIVMHSKTISLGRILKTRGRFHQALVSLLTLLQENEDDDTNLGGWRKVLLSNVADLYSELGQPLLAQKILIPELEKMRLTGSHDTSAGRRLQLALAESWLRNDENRKAQDALEAINSSLDSMEELDVIAKRAKFRVWSGLARVALACSRWEEAIIAWNRAAEALDILGRRTGMQPGLVHLGRSYALWQQEDAQLSVEEARKGLALLDGEGERRYWIVGLDSYWRDHIIHVIGDVESLRRAK